MGAIRSLAMAGVAGASLPMMHFSPTITPEFGSPSVVYAQQWALSCSKVIFLSARSDWLAKALDMDSSLCNGAAQPPILRTGHPRHGGCRARITGQPMLQHGDDFF